MIDAPRTAAVESLPVEPEDGGILDILGLIRRRKWLIMLGLVAGLGLAGLYYFQATPIFESEVEVLVMPKNQNLPSASATSPANVQGQEVVDEGIMATHVQLLQSPKIISAALEQLDIDKMETFKEAIAKAQLDGRTFNPLGFVAANLEVTTGGEGKAKDARVLRGTFRGPFAEDNAALLDALVTSYQSFLGETFSDTSQEAVELITTAKDKLGEELANLETAYRDFRKQTPIFWKGKESLNLHQERLGKIEETLTEVSQKYSETKARLKVIDESIAKAGSIDDLSDVEQLALLSESDVDRLNLLLTASRPDPNSKLFQATDPIRREQAQTEYQKLLALLLDEAKLMEDYGSDHPKVQSVREQIRLTQAFLQKNSPRAEMLDPVGMKPKELLSAHLGLLRHDLAEYTERKTDLERMAKEEEKAAKELVGFELQGETMSSEIDRKKELYETIIDRLREISLIKDYGGYITEVIAPATVPDKQASPKLLLVVGLGGLLGLFFGGGLAFLADLVDKTFRTPEEVSQSLDLPILAHVPHLIRSRAMRAAASNGNGRKIPQVDVIVYHKPNGPEAEALRGLRTALYFGNRGTKYQILQVTSPNPGDGKTMVSSNLAVTAANAGRRVLLVDADLRRPRLEKLFHARAKIGLAEVLKGEVEWADTVQDTEIANLSILPCGTIPSNPAELLTLDSFDNFLAELRGHYDLVILDSAPLLPVSDSASIAPRVDGVLLTVRITKNGGPGAIHARDMLAAVEANIVGVVVNDVDQNKEYRSAYYGRKYGYGYGGYRRKYGYAYEEKKKTNEQVEA